MNDRQSSRSEIGEYVDTLTAAEREAVDAASVALDVAGLAYRARTARGFTQAEAAEASDLKQQSISRIEGGTINVTVRTLERYLRALGFTLRLGIFDESTGDIIDQVTLNHPNDEGDTQLLATVHHRNNGTLKR